MSTYTDAQLSRVRKLLAQAKDRAGTPEGDTFQRKAMELMSQYAIDDFHLHGESESGDVIKYEFKLSGSYTYERGSLAYFIAEALHCAGVMYTTGQRCHSVAIYGVPRHIERVKQLVESLTPIMVSGAMNSPVEWYESAVVTRRSYMRGFMSAVYHRLKEIEKESEAAYTTAAKSGELVLLSDAERAKKARQDNSTGKIDTHTV